MAIEAIGDVLSAPVRGWYGYDLFNTINGIEPKQTDLFQSILDSQQQVAQQQDQVTRDPAWINIYLQWPNPIIKQKAFEIVDRNDSDDVKMQKIQSWVVRNIKYETDTEQYGFGELWVPPVMTLKTGKGDCEDGAFLIMSLALNSGVERTRLRMYGGFVDAGPGAASGGHGWVAYKREVDDEWVAVDFSYYPDLRAMDKRIPLTEDEKYVDDYFFMTDQFVVVTDETNRIRNPEVYLSTGGLTTVDQRGGWLNAYA